MNKVYASAFLYSSAYLKPSLCLKSNTRFRILNYKEKLRRYAWTLTFQNMHRTN